MQKIFLFILMVYFLYYAGNIIYDLFFDNVKVVENQDDGQLVNMVNDNQYNKEDSHIKYVSPESVGESELPDSANIDERDLYNEDEQPTNYNTDVVKKNYDEEKLLERYNLSEAQERELLEQEALELEKENQEKKQLAKSLLVGIDITKENIVASKSDLKKDQMKHDYFDQFLETAKSHVVMKSNDNGHKTYKTTLSI